MSSKAYLFLAAPVLLWSATPLLVTELSAELPILQVNWLATAFSVLILSLITTVTGKWSLYRTYSKRQIATMIGMGAVGIFPYTTLYYLAFALAPAAAGSSNIINYLWPIWIVILSVPLLRERLSWPKVLGLVLSFAGVYLIVSGGTWIRFPKTYLRAYISAGCGAFFWGLFSVLNKRHRFEALSAMLLYNASALVCFSLGAVFFSDLTLPTLRSWLLLLLLGGCVNGLGYFFWILALRAGETAHIANLAYLTPFMALVYLAIFRNAPIRWIQILALIFILAGPLLQQLRLRKGGVL